VAAEVRPELERDRSTVHAINTGAFGRAEEAGHILFTPVSLAGYRELIMGLAPMAVEPARQRAGIGSALVRAGLVPAEAFMALELRPGALRGASGTVKYHPAFAEVEQ
jgi:putative acetyltransferase